jgi:hypothetical protein
MVPWQHPFFTAFTGIGIASARLQKNVLVKLIALPIGYAFAVFTHALHNSFSSLIGGLEGFALGSLTDWFGWFMMAFFVVFMISRERALLQRQLQGEVVDGTITAEQYQRALSPLTMSTAFLTGGAPAARFYRLCGELAHKKEQLSRFGDERGNTALVQQLRSELSSLRPLVRT